MADTRPKTRTQAASKADHVVELILDGEYQRAHEKVDKLDDWLAAQVNGGDGADD